MNKLNNRGITMAELIVSFAIVGVAMIYFTQILVVVRGLYYDAQKKVNDFTNKNYELKIVDEYISSKRKETVLKNENLTSLCAKYSLSCDKITIKKDNSYENLYDVCFYSNDSDNPDTCLYKIVN